MQVKVLSRYVEKIAIYDITNGFYYDTCNLFNNIRQGKISSLRIILKIHQLRDQLVKKKKEKRKHIMIPVSALNLYAIVFILKTICLCVCVCVCVCVCLSIHM